jgi:uncharacterized protein YggE
MALQLHRFKNIILRRLKMFHTSLTVILTMIIFNATLAFGGQIQIIGQGEASAPPDQFQIEAKVIGICYDSIQQAKTSTADIANQIVSLETKYLRDSQDKITTHPGGFIRDTETIPTGDNHSKVLCERKWKTWNTIRIVMHDRQSLVDIQNDLVAFIAPIESLQPQKVEQCFVQLSSPAFGLKESSQLKLRKMAQTEAFKDAKEQFANFDANCHFRGAKLTSLNPPNFSSVMRYASKAASAPESSTPMLPENISISATWNFTWDFELAPGCYQ